MKWIGSGKDRLSNEYVYKKPYNERKQHDKRNIKHEAFDTEYDLERP